MAARNYKKANHYIIITERVDSDKWPSRETVYSALEDIYGLGEKVAQVIVAMENFNSGKSIVCKILLKFKTEYVCETEDIKQALLCRGIFDSQKEWIFELAKLKNIGDAVRDCTRFDMDCGPTCFGHNRDNFHQEWIAHNLCVKLMGKVWNPCHPIAAEYSSRGKAALEHLKARWQYYEGEKAKLIPLRKFVNKYQGWQGQVVDSWNESIDCSRRGYKPKQLYIWGDSGTYKSSFVDYLFGKLFSLL
jgi:hypothetical protein